MSYHPFMEQGHKCPGCGSRSICTMEDGYCEGQGVCDNCIKAAVYEGERQLTRCERSWDRIMGWGYDHDYERRLST